MLKRVLFILAVLTAGAAPAYAQSTWQTPQSATGGPSVGGGVGMCLNASGLAIPCGPSTPSYSAGAYPPAMVPSSTLTRAANTTAYTGNQLVCAFTSVTLCAPVTISLASTNGGQGIINRVTLLKSGSTTTNANFTVWFFSTAPTVTGKFDASAYTGPFAADMPSYLGSATCTSPTATSDASAQTWYECTLTNPNAGGAIEFQALAGHTYIDALISVTAAYSPANAEQFTVNVGGVY